MTGPDTVYALVSGDECSFEVHATFALRADAVTIADQLVGDYDVIELNHWPAGTGPDLGIEWTVNILVRRGEPIGAPEQTYRRYLPGDRRAGGVCHHRNGDGTVLVTATAADQEVAAYLATAKAREVRAGMPALCLAWQTVDDQAVRVEWCLQPAGHDAGHLFEPRPLPRILTEDPEAGTFRLEFLDTVRDLPRRAGPLPGVLVSSDDEGAHFVYDPEAPAGWWGPLADPALARRISDTVHARAVNTLPPRRP